jgi:hypothetical protein
LIYRKSYHDLRINPIINKNNGSNTPIINYGVSSREGKIYRSSKTEEQGYQKVELQSGGVTYHKYLNGLSGRITYVNRDVKEIVGTDGKKKKLDNFKVFLNDGVNAQALSFTTYSQEWKLFISKIYNVDFTKNVIVSFYKKKEKEGDRLFLNCSVKYENETTPDGKDVYPEWLDTKTVSKGGLVPDPTKNKKDEWDWTDNDIWYQDRMVEIINRFMDSKSNNTHTPQPKTEAQVQNAVFPQTPAQAFPTAGELKTEADFQPLPF